MTLPMQRSVGHGDRWRPLREFENLYSEMDRLAQSVFGAPTGDGAWLPAADIVETDDAYVIEVELPGVRREDVDVALNGNELVVTGECKERKREGLVPPSYSKGRQVRVSCHVAGQPARR